MSLQKEPSKHTHDWPHTPLFIALLNYSKQLHNFACYTAPRLGSRERRRIEKCHKQLCKPFCSPLLQNDNIESLIFVFQGCSHHRLASGKWSYVCEKTILKASPNVPFWPFMSDAPRQSRYSHQTISWEFTLKFRDSKTRRLSPLLPHVPHTHSKYRLI